MTRFILKSIGCAVCVFGMYARVFAVWPPSTALEVESEGSMESHPTAGTSRDLSRDVQTLTIKLEQDEHRLDKVIQDINDLAALKKVSAGQATETRRGPN